MLDVLLYGWDFHMASEGHGHRMLLLLCLHVCAVRRVARLLGLSGRICHKVPLASKTKRAREAGREGRRRDNAVTAGQRVPHQAR